ncbi:MAG: DUF262 domain-containing protein [Chitinophagaceae bacterium]|nr:DUF262 domain-containing protein [Chitinophagaceae bacterium]
MSEDHVSEIAEEIDDQYSNDDLYNITSWGADLSFRELITMYDENELIKPELQRQYVWDKVEASRFIDSLLLGLPVPSIFLANTGDEQKLIIDGFQRIMTVYDYVKGIWSKDGNVFRLSGSDKINPRWQGKAFTQLNSSEQKKIKSTTIHAIVFEQTRPKHGDTSLYQIFERINTGGRTLVAQEIRNCVYQGALNTLLFSLNKNKQWRGLFGGEPDNRMRDMEYILRYFALNTSLVLDHPKGNISLKKLLNEYMGDAQNNSVAAIASQERVFSETMDFITKNIGENAFYNIVQGDPSKIRKRFYPTVFDSISIATARALVALGDVIPKVNLEAKRLVLLQDESYRKFTSEGTMQAEHIQGRINLAMRHLYGI